MLVIVVQGALDGLVLSGPAVTPTAGSPLAKRLAPVLSALVPDLGVARLDAEEKITRDSEVVRCYRDDPLVYRGRIRARTGAEILAVVQRLPAALPRLSVPLLVLHGTDDQIHPLAGSVMVHEAVFSADKTLRRYPGLYHEVFNEPEREQILSSGSRRTYPATDPLRIQRAERGFRVAFNPLRPLNAVAGVRSGRPWRWLLRALLWAFGLVLLRSLPSCACLARSFTTGANSDACGDFMGQVRPCGGADMAEFKAVACRCRLDQPSLNG
jgi:hypothetical protein